MPCLLCLPCHAGRSLWAVSSGPSVAGRWQAAPEGEHTACTAQRAEGGTAAAGARRRLLQAGLLPAPHPSPAAAPHCRACCARCRHTLCLARAPARRRPPRWRSARSRRQPSGPPSRRVRLSLGAAACVQPGACMPMLQAAWLQGRAAGPLHGLAACTAPLHAPKHAACCRPVQVARLIWKKRLATTWPDKIRK